MTRLIAPVLKRDPLFPFQVLKNVPGVSAVSNIQLFGFPRFPLPPFAVAVKTRLKTLFGYILSDDLPTQESIESENCEFFELFEVEPLTFFWSDSAGTCWSDV